MSILNSVRYLLSRASSALGMKESLRSFYMGKANNYVFNLSPEAVNSAWIRRSVTNHDFSPFLSDVDLTIVIDEKKMNLVHLHDDLLVKDVQIVPASFLDSWISAGGFRNYLQGEWIPLRGSPIPQSHFSLEDACLAFDLGHEIYLLYHQLEKKLHLFNEPYTNHARKKILQDLIKVKKFWITKDFTLLTQARESFQIPESIERFMTSFSHFCTDLSSHLKTPLNTFRCSDLMTKDYGDYFEINLEMVGKKVIVVRKFDHIKAILKKFPTHFIAPESFIDLVKGIGVQEQTLLNQLATDKSGHYFKFNQQRLALDLVGAAVQFPDNHRQLYYCFKNIQEFVTTINPNLDVPEWENIENRWKNQGLVAQSRAELFRLSQAYLEVLRTMG